MRLPWIEKTFRWDVDEIIDQGETYSELYDKDNIKAYYEAQGSVVFDDDEDDSTWNDWCDIADLVLLREFGVSALTYDDQRTEEESVRVFRNTRKTLRTFVEMYEDQRFGEEKKEWTIEEQKDYFYEWFFEVDEILRDILYK